MWGSGEWVAFGSYNDGVGTYRVTLASPEEVAPGPTAEEYRSWLSEAELARYRRYRSKSDRHLFLTAHALLRRSLSEYCNHAYHPSAWQFEDNENGRPQVALPMMSSVQFSLSHCPGMAACVVTNGVACGIDVERIGRVRDVMSVAKRVFTGAELATLSEAQDLAQEFTNLWALKEATIKASGLGDKLRPQSFSVTGAPSPHSNLPGWELGLFSYAPNYVMAIATAKGKHQ